MEKLKGKVKKCLLSTFLCIKGDDTSVGVNDVVVVQQEDGSFKASPLQVYLKITSSIRPAISTSTTKALKIQIKEGVFIDCMNIDCNDLQSKETEHTCELSNKQLNEMELDSGINPAFLIIEDLNVRIPFFIYLFNQTDKIIVTDIDGTITQSDGKGFFCGPLGCKVHHKSVNEFHYKAYDNGYKILYLTARPIAYQYTTRKYLFEILKDNETDHWRLPQNPVFCLPGEIADAALWDSTQGASGKTTALSNVLNLFKDEFRVVAGAYGNNNSDSDAYNNVGIPLEKTFIIDKNSKIVNLLSKEETSYKVQASDIDTLYPKY